MVAGSSLLLISKCLCSQFWCSGPFSTPLSFGLEDASVWGILSCGDESILGNLEFEPVGGLGWQNNLV